MILNNISKVKDSYDVIVIGGGLAGMTAANKMARDNYKVLLIESQPKLGGFATWFNRKSGHIFDVSLHGFPVGMIKTCRKYWSKEIADKIIQLKKVRFLNPMYDISTDFTQKDFTKILIEHFGQSEDTVNSFFAYLKEMNFYDQKGMTNQQLFEKFFPNRPDIVRFLLEPIVYANGSTLQDEAISYGIVFSNFMSQGVYTFEGGTDLFIKLLTKELLKNSVDILYNTTVDKILLEDNKAVGVVCRDQKINSSAVLSNANIVATVKRLLGEENTPKDLWTEISKVRLNTSSCQVYIGLKAGRKLECDTDLLFYSEDYQFNSDNILSPQISNQTFSIYHDYIRPSSKKKFVVVSSSNARYSDWNGLNDHEYQLKKEFVQKRAVEALEKIFPGIQDDIEYLEVATPLTMERYTLHPNGSSFGTKFEGLDLSMKLHQIIPGVFHAGSVGIIMSGWLGAANYGVISAFEIENYLSAKNKDNANAKI